MGGPLEHAHKQAPATIARLDRDSGLPALACIGRVVQAQPTGPHRLAVAALATLPEKWLDFRTKVYGAFLRPGHTGRQA